MTEDENREHVENQDSKSVRKEGYDLDMPEEDPWEDDPEVEDD